MHLQDFALKLQQASNVEQSKQILVNYLADLNIKHFAFTYYAYHPMSRNRLKYSFSSGTMEIWHNHFVAENYDEIDSTLEKVYHSVLPVFWTIQGQITEARSAKERKMRAASQKVGADKGVSVPIHGPNGDFAILMVEQKQGENCLEKWREYQYELLAAAYCYYQYIKKHLLQPVAAEQKYNLSAREMQCLNLLAQNLPLTAIAKNMRITERTVNYHIQKINKKFGTQNKYQSLLEALRNGLLSL